MLPGCQQLLLVLLNAGAGLGRHLEDIIIKWRTLHYGAKKPVKQAVSGEGSSGQSEGEVSFSQEETVVLQSSQRSAAA